MIFLSAMRGREAEEPTDSPTTVSRISALARRSLTQGVRIQGRGEWWGDAAGDGGGKNRLDGGLVNRQQYPGREAINRSNKD